MLFFLLLMTAIAAPPSLDDYTLGEELAERGWHNATACTSATPCNTSVGDVSGTVHALYCAEQLHALSFATTVNSAGAEPPTAHKNTWSTLLSTLKEQHWRGTGSAKRLSDTKAKWGYGGRARFRNGSRRMHVIVTGIHRPPRREAMFGHSTHELSPDFWEWRIQLVESVPNKQCKKRRPKIVVGQRVIDEEGS